MVEGNYYFFGFWTKKTAAITLTKNWSTALPSPTFPGPPSEVYLLVLEPDLELGSAVRPCPEGEPGLCSWPHYPRSPPDRVMVRIWDFKSDDPGLDFRSCQSLDIDL